MTITYQYRYITLMFSGAANFQVENLRIVARVIALVAPEMSNADILVWGLSLDHINELTTYQGAIDNCSHNTLLPQNRVQILAGDADNGIKPIFYGLILGAWPEMMNAPLGPFHIIAQAQAESATDKYPPTSFDGQVSSCQVANQFIGAMGAMPDVAGMKCKQLESPHFKGSKLEQFKQLMQMTGDQWVYQNGLITITSDGQSRMGDGWAIAPPSYGKGYVGLVGYPSFTMGGLLVKVEYSFPIYINDTINVTSTIQLANGDWNVIRADYDLESQQPGGHWFITLEGVRLCQGGDGGGGGQV
jgi:hypothetical protein